jgi:hypothetical protein
MNQRNADGSDFALSSVFVFGGLCVASCYIANKHINETLLGFNVVLYVAVAEVDRGIGSHADLPDYPPTGYFSRDTAANHL